MQDLPETNPYPHGSRSYLAYKCAYDLFMSSETFASMCGRILGFLLTEAPSDEGRLHLTDEINSCTNTKKLIELGECYMRYFIIPCE
jgi:hypothetical protein